MLRAVCLSTAWTVPTNCYLSNKAIWGGPFIKGVLLILHDISPYCKLYIHIGIETALFEDIFPLT